MKAKNIVEYIANIGVAVFAVGVFTKHFGSDEIGRQIRDAGAILILVKYVYQLFHFKEYKKENLTLLGMLLLFGMIAFIINMVKG